MNLIDASIGVYKLMLTPTMLLTFLSILGLCFSTFIYTIILNKMLNYSRSLDKELE